MSSLASRSVIEMWAAKDCSSPGSTHWDGCPCSILRMDDRMQELEADAAMLQDALGKTRTVLERIASAGWSYTEGSAMYRDISDVLAATAIAATPTEALERQWRIHPPIIPHGEPGHKCSIDPRCK